MSQLASLSPVCQACYRYDLASLVAQMVKCLSAMQETWVRSLGWEDPLEKEMATHSSTLAWKIPGQRSLVGYLQSMHGVAEESDLTELLSNKS